MKNLVVIIGVSFGLSISGCNQMQDALHQEGKHVKVAHSSQTNTGSNGNSTSTTSHNHILPITCSSVFTPEEMLYLGFLNELDSDFDIYNTIPPHVTAGQRLADFVLDIKQQPSGECLISLNGVNPLVTIQGDQVTFLGNDTNPGNPTNPVNPAFPNDPNGLTNGHHPVQADTSNPIFIPRSTAYVMFASQHVMPSLGIDSSGASVFPVAFGRLEPTFHSYGTIKGYDPTTGVGRVVDDNNLNNPVYIPTSYFEIFVQQKFPNPNSNIYYATDEGVINAPCNTMSPTCNTIRYGEFTIQYKADYNARVVTGADVFITLFHPPVK